MVALSWAVRGAPAPLRKRWLEICGHHISEFWNLKRRDLFGKQDSVKKKSAFLQEHTKMWKCCWELVFQKGACKDAPICKKWIYTAAFARKCQNLRTCGKGQIIAWISFLHKIANTFRRATTSSGASLTRQLLVWPPASRWTNEFLYATTWHEICNLQTSKIGMKA